MNSIRKYFAKSLFAVTALLLAASTASAQVALGAATGFSVLGGTNVTCTSGVVVGDVGVAPGGAVPFTNTGCVIGGLVPPATNAAAVPARADFLSAYALTQTLPCEHTLLSTISGPMTLAPGVYCTGAALTATDVVLTLDAGNNPNAAWVFKVNGALTTTNFTVVMANGGQACNVYWAPAAAVTMTTSAMKGNILAGNAIDGSITMTGGTLAGNVYANVAVTMTDANVIGCAALTPPPATCKKHDHDDHDKKHHKCKKDSGKKAKACHHDHSKKHHSSDDDEKDDKHGRHRD